MDYGKGILIFVAGAGISGIATWLITKEYYKRQFEQELENRWNDIRGYNKEVDSKEPSPVIVDTSKTDLDILKKQTVDYKKLATNYQSYYDKTEPDDILDDGGEFAAENEFPDENRFRPPYEIEAQDAGYGLDLSTVTWYDKDEVLADEMTGTRLDIYETIGVEGVKARIESDNDAVYIRNEKIGIDYEVLEVNDSYERVMRELYGVSEEQIVR